MEYVTFTAKTIDAALSEAAEQWNTTVDQLEYEVVDE